ncbi:MAG: sigma-70 family RNA polymerase sigma factor [Gemmataceae bacterium]
MPNTLTMVELIRRVRSGDEQAAEEFVRRYEPVLRIAVRARLTDPNLVRLMDSGDVCQSVLASFFMRAAAGQYDLDSPARLLSLLTRMAHNKLVSRARHASRKCRDGRRVLAGAVAGRLPCREPSPDAVVAGRDLLRELRSRLSPLEREIADQRMAGQSWEEIATSLGGTAQARRKQLRRAVDDVSHQLGLDDTDA